MSALLGLFGPRAAGVPVRAILARMADRGGDAHDVWVGDDAVLAVSRHAWECAEGVAGPAAAIEEGDCVCVTDATLYYRDDLARALGAAGVRVEAQAPAGALVIAAYRAWGATCAARLEGDFAWILWDRARRRVVASREFTGKRPLYHATLGADQAQLVLASSVHAVAAHPDCPDAYDPRVLAATISQLWASSDETWHASVRELPAGSTLVREAGRATRVASHWDLTIGEGPALPFDAAADALRALLERATLERLAPDGPTAVSMSGGWDSPAVFAAGQSALRARGDARALLPVSLSYPEGDPGREDELIAAIAEHWSVPVRWIDVESIPLFVDPVAAAARRDGPFAHTYEHWNRRLAAEGRALGARVLLDGNGGDQVFQLSDIYLADLLRQGRWFTLAREWRAKGGGTQWRPFLAEVVVPALPAPVRRVAERLRGRPFRRHWERVIPDWVRPDFLRRHAVREWERTHLDALRDRDHWRSESRGYLTAPAFARAFQQLGDFARDAGVELRSPLLDARVVAFATARPREDRNCGLETKRLLRHAMRGLLPEHVLAPRAHRTGITSAYSHRRMLEAMPALLERLFAEPLLLAELGIVEPAPLRRAWDQYLSSRALHVKIPLFLTLHAELWLRARRAEVDGLAPVTAPADRGAALTRAGS
ncbi:MAG TPA: asparagine synthase-related protein [Gemmatimonadaceae bacterium]|nr:asparagine synthase-related protein [Gemmatimonadaceae bacterium]